MRLCLAAAIPLLLLAGCAPLRTLIPSRTPAERLAGEVTIVRDSWGVPHIFAPTDAAAAFGLAYAQAEDDYWQIEEDYLHALGRASHWHGERYLAADMAAAAFEVERHAREEYELEPPERRAVWDAFAAGLNYYIGTTTERPRLITHYEPWMPFALVRAARDGIVSEVRLGEISADGVRDVQLVTRGADTTSVGARESSMWAVSPARTTAGSALLLHADVGSLGGSGRPYEVMLMSDEGWHVRGHATLGTPVPRAGHNATIAWARTRTAEPQQMVDVSFDHPADRLMYRSGDDWRTAVEWQDTLRVNSPAGVIQHVVRFKRTEDGPVLSVDRGDATTVRSARLPEGGALQEMYAQSRARDLDEFRRAISARPLSADVVAADTEGSIYSRIGGQESIDPARGWIAGSDSDGDDVRAGAARRMLDADSAWTFSGLVAAAFDTRLEPTDAAVADLAAEWEQIGGLNAARARQLDEVVDLLRSWDPNAAVDSEVATLYLLWQDRVRRSGHTGEFVLFRAMEDVLARLQRDFGTSRVAWGEVNRLQRRDREREPGFSDERPSLPLPGGPAWSGSAFTNMATSSPDARRQYALHGTRWIGAYELGQPIRMMSIVPFGQSGDPASAHGFDQAPLYTAGQLREGAFTREAAQAAARRTYRPLDAAVRELP